MRIVAVEMSASKGSVALVDQGDVRASFSWEEKRENRQQLFDALKALAVEWSSVDQFVVGRGPGAFSGMRIAFSVVNALAAPDKTPVVAHNSGAALVHARGAPRVWWLGMLAVNNFGLVRLRGLNFHEHLH